MKHCSSGVMSTASQLLMLETVAVTLVRTAGIGVLAATPTVSVTFMALLGDVPTIDRIHVRPFRYRITLLYSVPFVLVLPPSNRRRLSCVWRMREKIIRHITYNLTNLCTSNLLCHCVRMICMQHMALYNCFD